MPEPTPHARHDCGFCGERDADMQLTYPPERETNPGRVCRKCVGPMLARLVREGRTVTVTALDEENHRA